MSINRLTKEWSEKRGKDRDGTSNFGALEKDRRNSSGGASCGQFPLTREEVESQGFPIDAKTEPKKKKMKVIN